MRADDGVGAHDAMLDRGEMHGAALAAHEAVVALHQFAKHLLDRYPARQRVRVTAIGAEGQVAGLHGRRKSRGNRFLAEREVARSLDQILQEQIEGALLALADQHLQRYMVRRFSSPMSSLMPRWAASKVRAGFLAMYFSSKPEIRWLTEISLSLEAEATAPHRQASITRYA